MKSFARARFQHFFFHKIFRPYIRFTLFGLIIYATFSLVDYYTLHTHTFEVIAVRVTFVICATLMLYVASRKHWKYTEAAEAIFLILAGWIVHWIGYIALMDGNSDYQSGVIVMILYLGTFSRMRFKRVVFTILAIVVPYLLLLHPILHQISRAKEANQLSILLTTALMCTIATYRRELEYQKRYQEERQRRRQELTLAAYSSKLKKLSETDALTGLYNRHFLRHTVLPKVHLSSSIGVVIADLDHFKKINDQFGHDVGDAVIKEVAAIIRQALPKQATAIRYGGEEFLVILPNCTLQQVDEFASLLQHQCEHSRFEHGSPVTMSVGYWHGESFDKELKTAINLADKALYTAKQSGRNRVESMQAEDHIQTIGT